MAFTTIPGGNGADVYFEGTVDNDDILLSLSGTENTQTQYADGFSGDDSMTFVNTTGVVGTVTAVGGLGNDAFVFTQDAANATDARLYNSLVRGAEGDDTFNIAGGAWTTEIKGGAGNDVFVLGTNYTKTQIKGGDNGDTFTGGTAGVVTRDNATFLELDNSKIRGQGGNDTAMDFRGFLLSSDDSTINGNGGNDTIRLGFFDKVDGLLIGGGQGDDDIDASVDTSAPDGIQFNGGSGVDSIVASTGDDLINGGSGTDTIFGGAGDDTIDAGTEADFADGEAGADTISGGTGNDTLEGGAGKDTINGNQDADLLSGEAAADTIAGGEGKDTILGGTGDDSLSGGTGADTITDGTGDDTIVGGDAGDFITVAGGLEDDVYVLNAITDSNAASTGTGAATVNAWDTVTGFGTVGVGATTDYASGTQIDFTAIDDQLAGTTATSIQITDITANLAAVAGIKDSFSDLVTAFNTPGAPLMDASSEAVDGLIQAYVFTHNMDGAVPATNSTYLIINDTAAQLTAGDVMIDFGDQSGDMVGFMNELDISIAKGTGLAIA